MKTKIYIGYKNGEAKDIFLSASEPTASTHPQFAAAIGPFQTWRGARFMALYGANNPHCQCVADAERLGKIYGNEFLKS